ncbi:hypothetical protein [Azohydromonas caseinilytica]|uniref:Uncharacterized protein n=1 Tax=Azohydromonas caseinilytica TaxID=2728836 RepID=A0A848F934_9BURK|nr:hypothetical protein [Azohydromonas caseinilytica]NML14999.1 hypothetical protein [Azohydromonas caseinilytica]
MRTIIALAAAVLLAAGAHAAPGHHTVKADAFSARPKATAPTRGASASPAGKKHRALRRGAHKPAARKAAHRSI